MSERSIDDSARRWPRPALLLCCVLLTVLASYLPVLGAPLIWDDQHLIEQNPLVLEIRPLTDYFEHGFWQTDELQPGRPYYRPLTILSLALDQRLYGGNPGGFHATNLFLHLSCSVLLYALLRIRGCGGYAAVLGTALWALHPRLTEAVAWVSGRTDVLATGFVLAALIVQTRPSPRNRVFCAILLLLGLLCKEVALAGVVAVLLAEVAVAGRSPAWSRARCCVPTLLACAAYAVLRVHATGIVPSRSGSTSARVLPALAALGRYFVMLCTPWFPNLQIGRVDRPSVADGMLGLGLLLGLSASLIWALRRRRPLPRDSWVPLALLAIGLGLVLHLVRLSISVLAADRFLYLPLVGLTLLLAPRVAAPGRPTISAVGAGLMTVSFAVATFISSNLWADEVALWARTYRSNPDNQSWACVELGRLYARAGLLSHAFSLDQHCAERAPGALVRLTLRNNAASVLARSGHYAEALRVARELAAEPGSVPVVNLNLAVYLSYQGEFAAARRVLSRVMAENPSYTPAAAFAKRLPELEELRRRADALQALAPSIERARALAELGAGVEALDAWRAAFDRGELSTDACVAALGFALAQADARSIDAVHARCEATLAAAGETRLAAAYQSYQSLAERLLSVWPTLGVTLRPLNDPMQKAELGNARNR